MLPVFTSILLQAYQTSYSVSLGHDIISILYELWQAHSFVAYYMRQHCSEGYKELSSALVLASQGRLLLQALQRGEKEVAVPGRMVAAVVTADPVPACDVGLSLRKEAIRCAGLGPIYLEVHAATVSRAGSMFVSRDDARALATCLRRLAAVCTPKLASWRILKAQHWL